MPAPPAEPPTEREGAPAPIQPELEGAAGRVGGEPAGGDEPADGSVALRGVVDRVVFRGQDGFAVLSVRTSGARPIVSVVGPVGLLHEGDEARFVGRWEEHGRYGPQLRASLCQPIEPSTRKGVEAYLARLPDVGPVLASRLLAHFGDATLEVIERSSGRLREVAGVGPKRAQAIVKAFKEEAEQRETLVFLHAHDIAGALAQRVIARYGVRTIERVSADPFRLAEEVPGVGFRTADRIAATLGLGAEHPGRLRAGLRHTLERAREQGHLYLPRLELLREAGALLALDEARLEPSLDALVAEAALVELAIPGRWVGLPEHILLERAIALDLRARAGRPGAPAPSDDDLARAEHSLGLALDPVQRQAVRMAATARVAVVTGGPGTGKTTLLRATLALLLRRGLQVALAAPTGRAARRLGEATGAEARTLHRLLEFQPQSESFQRDADHPLEADAVIVDEVSMVDVPLMAALCAALKPEAQLLLVGDADQLPSVGPGLVLHDVLVSGVVPAVRLQRIFRQTGGSLIVENAHRVLEGLLPVAPPPGQTDADFYLMQLEEASDIAAALEAVLLRRIPARFGLDPRTEVQVLVPMHKGELGAERLNERLQALLNPDGPAIGGRGGLRRGDRVIQIRNDYELEIANGDVGILEGRGVEEGAARVRFDERVVEIPAARLDGLRLAYALSIHKSQGSEYPAVVLPLHTQHFMMLRRNLLYTAITRGRRLVVLIGSARAISLAVERNDAVQRYTRLEALLRQGAAG